MPNISITMIVNHDATDPDANDTTLDLNEVIFEKLFKDLDGIKIIDQTCQRLIVQFNAPIDNPSQYHMEE